LLVCTPLFPFLSLYVRRRKIGKGVRAAKTHTGKKPPNAGKNNLNTGIAQGCETTFGPYNHASYTFPDTPVTTG
jgi:hypothetical protein